MDPTSCFVKNCKRKLQTNAWIVSIHHEEPITINRFLEYVKYLRNNDILEVQATLMKRMTDNDRIYTFAKDNFSVPLSFTITVLPRVPSANSNFIFSTPEVLPIYLLAISL